MRDRPFRKIEAPHDPVLLLAAAHAKSAVIL
jgi:hypothetical protein